LKKRRSDLSIIYAHATRHSAIAEGTLVSGILH